MNLSESELAQAEDAARRIAKVFGPVGTSNANIHVNSGGFAVWLATTACLVMLALFWAYSDRVADAKIETDADIRELRGRINAQQAYINSIIRNGAPKPAPEPERK